MLLALGTFIRSKVPETPVFEKMKSDDALSKNPVGEAVGKNFKTFLIAVGLKLSEVSWVYMLTVFCVVYATTKLGLPKQQMLDAVMLAALCELVTLPFFGWLSDKIGRRVLFILGAIFTMAFAFPLFMMLESKDATYITLAIVIAMNFGHGMMFGIESAYFPELFGPRGALHRRFVRLPGLGGARRRLRSDHRHRSGRLFQRIDWRLRDDDRDCAYHTGGGACGPRNQG